MRGTGYKFVREIVESLREPIIAATDPKLRLAIKTKQRMTTTNCGWDAFWCKDIIERLCRDELAMRRLQRRREQKEARKKGQ